MSQFLSVHLLLCPLLVVLSACDRNRAQPEKYEHSSKASQQVATEAPKGPQSCADKWTMDTDSVCARYPEIGWACRRFLEEGVNEMPELWPKRGHPHWQGLSAEYTELILDFRFGCGKKQGKWYCGGIDRIEFTDSERGVNSPMTLTPVLPPNLKSLVLSIEAYWIEGDQVMRARRSPQGIPERELVLTLPGVIGVTKGQCAWSSTRVKCWGIMEWQRADTSAFSQEPVFQKKRLPVTIQGLPSSGISMVAGNSCALTTSGEVYCWGDNTVGQRGNGTQEFCKKRVCKTNLRLATKAHISDVRSISVAGGRLFALKKNGEVWTWGGGFHSRQRVENDHNPIPMPAFGTNNRMILTGYDQACVVKDNGALVCYGGLLNRYPIPGNHQVMRSNHLTDTSCKSKEACGPAESLPACLPL